MSSLNNNRILIVDDQLELRERLASLLSAGDEREKLSANVQSLREKLLNSVPDDSSLDRPKSKYLVDTVGKGQDALKKILAANEQGEPYAVIFIDMRMPAGWDGLKTAEEIRKVDKDIEMVIMTAFADYSQKEVAERVGCPEKLLYIKKPFHVEEILQMVLSLCAKWAVLQEQKENNILLEKLLKTLYHLRTSPQKLVGKVSLQSICEFLNASGGFLAQYNDTAGEWEAAESFGAAPPQAVKQFIYRNFSEMRRLSTRKHFGSDYFIPLGSSHRAAIVVFNAECKISSQWYKIFDLLTMSVDTELNRS